MKSRRILDGQRIRRRLRRSGGGTQPVTNERPGKPPFCALLFDLNEGAAPEPVYGQYPRGFLAKAATLLHCSRDRILHVCSGSLPPGEGLRVDIRPNAKPDIVADGTALPLAAKCVDAVLIDPPYSAEYARELYGTSYPRPAHLLREAARVVKPCGRIGIVHYIVPKPPPGTKWVMTRGLSVGFGFPMRALTVYVREQSSLPLLV